MLNNKSMWIRIVAYVLVAVLSFFVLFSMFSTQKMSNESDSTQTYLSEKRDQILTLAASSAGIAMAISMLPDDWGTSLSDQIAKISGALAIILSAIYLEKALVSFSGLIAFRLLIPVACLLFILDVLKPNPIAKNMAKRFCALALAIIFVVPISIYASKKIENNIIATDNIAVSETQEEDSASDNNGTGIENAATKISGKKAVTKVKNAFSSFIDGVENKANDIKDMATSVVGKSQEKYNDLKDEAVNTIEEIVDKLAIMIITACVIPLVVLIFLIWFLKVLFNIDLVGKVNTIKSELNTGNKTNNAEGQL